MATLRAKQVAAVALVASAVGLLALIYQSPPAPAQSRAFLSSEQCAACHAQVFAEWKESWHSRSWSDPDVLALSNDFANSDCIDCHAPRPVFETGIGQRVLPRTTRRAEGVDCIACHLLPDGGAGTVAGTLDDASAACKPVSVRDLAQPEFCGVCHDQHKTVQQWKETDYAKRGVGCMDCHMPFRGGDPNRGRDHTLHGAHEIALVN